MASLNKVQLIGNLGRDVELRYTPSNLAIATISIATTYKAKDKEPEVEWSRVVFFGRLAEIAGEYLKKGSSVYVEGRLRTQKWTDKSGVEKYTTEIVAESMQMLGDKSAGSERPSSNNQQSSRPQSAPMDDSALDSDIPF